jgi:2-amino-4-hydroxy-6-hydroxymethyldihydropteridine diphosphokinase
MEARTALLGLGSNVGDRRANLQRAVHAIEHGGCVVLSSSSTYDTDPVGEILDQPSFLNACLLVQTDTDPLELLGIVKEIERELGRATASARHAPRVIDIDILLVGGMRVNEERMTLPHEQLLARRFVLIPALELDFEMTAPGGERLADALAALDLQEGVRWAGPPLDFARRG